METELMKDPEKGEAAGAQWCKKKRCCSRGYEWKSKASILGVPLVHVAFGQNEETGRMNVAQGVVSIGTFAVGILTIAQAGIGVFTLAQFGVGVAAVAQFCAAIAGVGQFVAGVWAVGSFDAAVYD
eukprot:evm.model.scf_436.5 EVM.evm.TU.scf_436.5   scf_436:59835-60383(-)